jgi:hypothetical protein
MILVPVFGRCSVRISAGTPDILTKDFRGFLQSLEANAGVIPRLDQDRIRQNTFQLIHHPTLYSLGTENA